MNIAFYIQLLTILHQVIELLATFGAWGEWGPWSACSVTCGYGSVSRNRNWIFPNGSVFVNFTYSYTLVCDSQTPCPVNGGWSMWTAWSKCTVLCGNGTTTRTRECNAPKPTYEGINCNGSSIDQRRCNERICPELPEDFDLSQCDLNMFLCDSKLQCVSLNERCDDEVHCHDGSDEKDCITYLNMNSKGVPVRQTGAEMMLSIITFIISFVIT